MYLPNKRDCSDNLRTAIYQEKSNLQVKTADTLCTSHPFILRDFFQIRRDISEEMFNLKSKTLDDLR